MHLGAFFIILFSEYPNVMSSESLQYSFTWKTPEQQPAGYCYISHVLSSFLDVVSYFLFYRNKECQKKKRKIQGTAFAPQLIPPSCCCGLNILSTSIPQVALLFFTSSYTKLSCCLGSTHHDYLTFIFEALRVHTGIETIKYYTNV